MESYTIKSVAKGQEGYVLSYVGQDKTICKKTLPDIQGFKPQSGDILSLENHENYANTVVSRGEDTLAAFSVGSKSINIAVYDKNLTTYRAKFDNNAAKSMIDFADKMREGLDTPLKNMKDVGTLKIRHALVAAGMIGMLLSAGSDPAVPEHIQKMTDPSLTGFACGLVGASVGVKGLGHRLLGAIGEKVSKTGINVYGADGKVTRVVAGLDAQGNPTGDLRNQKSNFINNIANRVRGR